MKVIVSEKGQVTIPKRLRDRMGIRPGEVLEFEVQCGNLVACKTDPQDILADIDSVYGLLKGQLETDELIDDLRGPWPPSE